MNIKSFALIFLFITVSMLGLTGCSRTIDDVAAWKAKGNIEQLIKTLSDPKIEVRLAATEALGELKAEPAVNALAALFNDPEEVIILASVNSLAQISTPSVITPLTAALTLNYPEARKTAAISLGELKATGAVSQLVDVLNDSNMEIQQAAAISLGQIGDEKGSAGLAEKLNSDSDELRNICVVSLGKTGGETAIKGLIGALADKNPTIGNAAIQSLENLGESSIPFALKALKNDSAKIRAGAIAVLRKLDAVPETGADLIWLHLARASVDTEEGINKSAVQALVKLGNPAFDTLLEAAAHHVEDFREHATMVLERSGKDVLEKAVAAAEANASSSAKSWMAKRGSWPGAPSWRIDLWASIAVLNPNFKIDRATASSLEMQSRPAFNIIADPQFKVSRPYLPSMIALLGDTTMPPPAEPDYDKDGMPVIKKQRDLFRGETNRQLTKKKLTEVGYMATLPLIAAIEDEDDRVAGSAADILGSQGEKRALHPLMNVVRKKLAAGELLTDSPFYIALQKMDEPDAEPLLMKIRPNPDRAMRVFERKYPGIRPMSSETEDTTGHFTQPVTFRLGYIDNARVGELKVTFMKNGDGNWIPTPPLPDLLPAK